MKVKFKYWLLKRNLFKRKMIKWGFTLLYQYFRHHLKNAWQNPDYSFYMLLHVLILMVISLIVFINSFESRMSEMDWSEFFKSIGFSVAAVGVPYFLMLKPFSRKHRMIALTVVLSMYFAVESQLTFSLIDRAFRAADLQKQGSMYIDLTYIPVVENALHKHDTIFTVDNRKFIRFDSLNGFATKVILQGVGKKVYIQLQRGDSKQTIHIPKEQLIIATDKANM